jgi:hypothetical protein
MNDTKPHGDKPSRRSFVKSTAYVAPLILSLRADPAFASYGSGRRMAEPPQSQRRKPPVSDRPGAGRGKSGPRGRS